MKNILITFLLLMPTIASAEWAVGTGWDVHHGDGKNYTELRYIDANLFFEENWYEFGWSAYLGTDNTLGIELYVPLEDWELGFGVEHSDYQADIVETEWKYELRAGYNFSKNWSVQIFHKSNCRDICKVPVLNMLPSGPDDKSNKGFNYVGLMYRWSY